MVRTSSCYYAVILALLLVVTAAVYAPLRHAPFVYEDENWMAVAETGPAWTARPSRALTYETFHVTYQAVKLSPAVWHLTNVGLHLANGVLVFAVAATVIGAPSALSAAGLFLLHPLNAEAVSYVSGRVELLSTFFVLLAVWVVLGSGYWLARTIGCVLALIGAALSKEIGVVGVPLVLLTLACWRRKSITRLTPLAVCLWVVVGASLGTIWEQLQSYLVMSPRAGGSVLSVQEYALYQAGMVWKFLVMTVWPVGLSIDHDVLQFGTTWLALSAFGVVVAVVIAVLAWRVSPATTWAVGWMALALAPRFLVRTNEFLSEHQMYLALIGVWIGMSATVVTACRTVASMDAEFWETYQEEYRMLMSPKESA